MTAGVRVIAFYLPQFHPIPENDGWWGPGFTEWTNVARGRPLYRGHVQPHLPAHLGFYDLRLPEVREAQAELGRRFGIEGFCYWHYWFGGRRILERPFDEVLARGTPQYPFMLSWANETWSGVWHGDPSRVLIEQTYPGPADHIRHFEHLLPAFRDPRYIRVDGKPAFCIYRPRKIPNAAEVMQRWRRMALEAGLPGLYLIAEVPGTAAQRGPVEGFDAMVQVNLPPLPPGDWPRRLRQRLRRGLVVYDYEEWLPRFVTEDARGIDVHPSVVPNWDNTPRSGRRGMVLQGSTPRLFGVQVRRACRLISGKPPEHRLMFVKSWNEWAEGNYLEPDLEHGTAYLEALAAEIAADEQQHGASAPSEDPSSSARVLKTGSRSG